MEKSTTFETRTNNLINNNPKRSFKLNQELSKYKGYGEREFGTFLRGFDSIYVVLETLDEIFTELGMPELMTSEELLTDYTGSERSKKLTEKCNGKVTQVMLFTQVARIILGSSMPKNFNLNYRTGKDEESLHFENSIRLHFGDLKKNRATKIVDGIKSSSNENREIEGKTKKRKESSNISKIMNENRGNKKLEQILKDLESNRDFYVFLTGNNKKGTSSPDSTSAGWKALGTICDIIRQALDKFGVKNHRFEVGHVVAKANKDSSNIPEEVHGINNGNNLGIETANENQGRGSKRDMEKRLGVPQITKRIRMVAKKYPPSNKTDFNKWLKHIMEAYETYLSIDWEADLKLQKKKLIKMGLEIKSSKEEIGIM